MGSVFLLVGAWVSLQMWKAQQFGLGFLREVNAQFDARPGGPAEISTVHQVALAVSLAYGALAVANVRLQATSWYLHVLTPLFTPLFTSVSAHVPRR